MTFTIVTLGANMTKLERGFAKDGQGSWLCLKCFYPSEGDEFEGPNYGEFYLNLNTRTMKGELRCKDPWYAKSLIEAFSKSMQGEERV